MIVAGSALQRDVIDEADCVVIGSGPAGSIAAAKLARAGFKVVVLEEGKWFEPHELVPEEEVAYPALYQDGGSRATDDLSIMILQGRAAGGGSTVNWMTSLRTPGRTLEVWKHRHHVEDIDARTLGIHFAAVERRLHVHPATASDVNANNAVLRDGAAALGFETVLLPRNARDCTNLGLCGFGCPTSAKQTAQSTYLRDALDAGAVLYTETRATSLRRNGREVTHVECSTIPRVRGAAPRLVTLRCRWVFVAAGAINSPYLLLRSGLETKATGRRTWLHPVVATAAEFDRRIEPWYGSPQSIALESTADRGAAMGYFIETPPLHPMIAALAAPWLGAPHADLMARLERASVLIGLTIDGFGDSETGGTVEVDRDRRLRFSYRFTERLREAAVDAMKTMARIQFAAGARRVFTMHAEPLVLERPADTAKIDGAPFGPGRLSVFTAHQMGGLAMSEDRRRGVCDSRGRNHEANNVVVVDGSLFPTGVGVNPMLTIYAVASLVTERFIADESGFRASALDREVKIAAHAESDASASGLRRDFVS